MNCKKTMISWHALCLGAILSTATLSQPASAQGISADVLAAANEEGQLIVYTSNTDALMKVLVEPFEAKYPELRVNWIRLASATLFNRFTAEKEAGITQADLLWSGSTQLYQEHEDWFQPLTTAELPNLAIATDVVAKNPGYAVVSITPNVITYNTAAIPADVQAAELTSWEDLSDPRWHGQIAMGDPRNSSIVTSWLELMMNSYGEQWVTDFAKNVTLIDRGSAAVQQVGAGAFQIAIPTDIQHSADLRAQNAPVAFVIPAQPGHGALNSVAIPFDAAHPNAARVFADWVAGPEGQGLLCAFGQIPLRGTGEACNPLPEGFTASNDTIDDATRAKVLGLMGIAP